jgi:glycosyltransferase involved in cell wall biosynthesis
MIRLSERGGPYRGRNLAIAASGGEIVTFQDGDDWAHPRKLELQARALLNRGLAATASRHVRVDAAGYFSVRQLWPLSRWCPSSTMARRETFDRLGPFEPVSAGADSEYWARLIEAFGRRRVSTLTAPLTIAARRADSLTGDAKTGFGSAGFNLERLRYWEAWRFRHARKSRRS